jgi:hypothetical protein
MSIGCKYFLDYSLSNALSIVPATTLKPRVLDEAIILEESKILLRETTPDWLITPTAKCEAVANYRRRHVILSD